MILKKRKVYILYTVIFWLFIGPFYYRIVKNDRITTACWDAITQIYPTMLYTCRVIHRFFESILGGEEFVFPMLEWTLGMGEDTIGALNWHGFGDPFYLLTIFASDATLPYWYSFIFYLKIWCAGVAFIGMVRVIDRNRSDFAYIIGALVYCFSGFTQLSNMHAIFLHALVYTPLMIWGVYKQIENKDAGGGALLTIATCCFALSGFYFLYISSVTLAVIVLYSLWKRKAEVKEALSLIFRFILQYLLGIGLAATFFIPAVLWFLTSDRVGVKSGIALFASFEEIVRLIYNMALPQYDGEQVLSVSVIGIIALILVFWSKEKRQEKVNLVVLFICACMPVVSCIMSGFGEIYDRWEYVIVLYWAFLTVEMWDEFVNIELWKKATLGGLCVIFYCCGRKFDWFDVYHAEFLWKTFLSMVVCIIICSYMNRYEKLKKISTYLLFIVSVLLVFGTWKEIANDREIANVTYRDVVEELIPEREKGDFHRIEYEKTFAEPRLGMNLSFVLEYPGISEYNSMNNNSYINAFPAWDASYLSHKNGGLNYRTVLETMCAIKYYIGYSNNPLIVPYGFRKMAETQDGEFTLYKNEFALPLAYTYSNVFDENIYAEMYGLDKQQIMLQSAAIEGYEGNLEVVDTYDDYLLQSEYSIVEMNGATLQNDIIRVSEGATVTLNVELTEGCENYLVVNDENLAAREISIEGFRDKCQVGHLEREVINLGSVNCNSTISVEILFKKATEIKKSDIQVFAYDFANYEQYIKQLKRDTEGKIHVYANELQIDVDLDTSKIVCVAVPYGSGWKAEIDGKSVNTYRMNDMFIGVEVPQGEHLIRLSYVTPGIRLGIGVTIISFLLSIGIIITNSMKYRSGNVN